MRFTKLSIILASAFTLCLCSANAQMQSLRIDVNDLVYDAANDELLISVRGTQKWRGNTITRVKPATLEILGSVYVGSEPNRLSLSDSGNNLYVSLEGSARVARFNLASREVDLDFPIGFGQYGFHYAEDLQAQPGSENSVALAMSHWNATERLGAAVFDNGVNRGTQVNENFIDSVRFGASPNILYGVSTSTSSYEFTKMSVGPQGVSLVSSTSVNTVFLGDLQFVSGFLFSRALRLYNVEPLNWIQTFERQGIMVIDEDLQRAYRLVQWNGSFFHTYSLPTFQELSAVAISFEGAPKRAVLCGPNRIAFTGGHQLDNPTRATHLYVYTFK